MYLKRRSIYSTFILLSVLLFFSGCMMSIQSNVPDLEARAERFRKIVVLPPEVNICELSAGGVKEKRDDWCEKGKQNIRRAVKENMKDRGVRIKFMKVTRKNKKKIQEINALYRAVAYSIITHTYVYQGNTNVFRERIQNFDYSIGSVEKILKKYKGDGLLIVYAADEISSSGRKALRVIKALNPFSAGEHGGVTSMIIALTDKKGSILWMRSMADAGGYDLREQKSAYAFVEELFEDYPRGVQ